MNTERVKKLEALLERVQRNARAPRSVASTVARNGAPAPVAPPPPSDVLDSERLAGPVSAEQPIARPEPVAPPVAEAPEIVPVAAVPAPASEPVRQASTAEEIDELELVEEEELLELDEADAIDEEAPASSRRVAASMDEALAEAADQLDSPKTVPPESGPEPVTGSELDLQPAAAASVREVPTTEQLGQTIALEEGAPADFELDEPLHDPVVAELEEPSHLEAELPSGGGAYHEDLAPPPGAREELERVRLGEVQAEVIARPIISTNVVEFIRAHAAPKPRSFVELLDEALSLGSD